MAFFPNDMAKKPYSEFIYFYRIVIKTYPCNRAILSYCGFLDVLMGVIFFAVCLLHLYKKR
ncbi:MAG: hypothetical protein DRG39_04795 [Deltaproteobacteria bacterium]|nr:MAG: hypothetical protein DRG39_04795 [Deltaproteobacteria bacterium]